MSETVWILIISNQLVIGDFATKDQCELVREQAGTWGNRCVEVPKDYRIHGVGISSK